MDLNLYELAQANVQLSDAEPEAIVAWAVERFAPHIVMGTGFSPNSVVLLHLVHRRFPWVKAIFVNPGDVLDESLEYARDIAKRFPALSVLRYAPDTPLSEEDRAALEAGGASRLEVYLRRKFPLMRQAIADLGACAILYGARFDQTEERTRFPLVNPDRRIGCLRVYPSLFKDERWAGEYIIRHDLPVHPLGLPSGERFECGLHDMGAT